MEAFKTAILIINIFSSLAIIALVLMQHGKGADAGANFGGSGSAQGVFGSGGNANFLTRMTGIAAMVFFASCLALGYVNSHSGKSTGMDFSDVQQTTQSSGSLNKHSDSSTATASAAASESSTSTSSEEVKAASESSGNSATAAAVTTGAVAAGKILADEKSDKSDKSEKSVENKKTKSDEKNTDKNKKSDNKSKSSDKKSDDKKSEKSAKKTEKKSDK